MDAQGDTVGDCLARESMQVCENASEIHFKYNLKNVAQASPRNHKPYCS